MSTVSTYVFHEPDALQLCSPPYHQYSIPNRDEHGGDPGIARYRSIQFLNSRGLLVRRRLFQHIPVPQDVVDYNDALRRQQVERTPVVIHIIHFVGVDEDEIERPLETSHCLERRPHADFDLLPDGRLREILARKCG